MQTLIIAMLMFLFSTAVSADQISTPPAQVTAPSVKAMAPTTTTPPPKVAIAISDKGQTKFYPEPKPFFTFRHDPIKENAFERNNPELPQYFLTLQIFETGTYQVANTSYKILSLLARTETEGADPDQEFYLQRYLWSADSLAQLKNDFHMGSPMNGSLAFIEKKLLQSTKAKQILQSSLSLPALKTVEKEFPFAPVNLALTDLSFEKKKLLKEFNTDGTKLWYQADSAVYYIETADHLFLGYSAPAYNFKLEDRQYACASPEKRGFSSNNLAPLGQSFQTLKAASDSRYGMTYLGSDSKPEEKYYSQYLEYFRGASATARNEDPETKAGKGSIQTKKEILAQHPIVYIKDKANRYFICRNEEMLQSLLSQFAEPLIYVYPEHASQITVSLGSNTWISSAAPPDFQKSWTFQATPTGLLKFPDPAKPMRFIFWEGRGPKFPKFPSSGVLLSSSQVDSYLSQQLPKFGLNVREIEDFKKYWVPALSKTPFVLVDFLLQEEVEAYIPLSVSAPIQNQIRIYINFRPLQTGDKIFPIKEFRPILRPQKNLLVEWGGIIWGQDAASLQ